MPGLNWLPIAFLLLTCFAHLSAQTQPEIPPPDQRYKADILVIVAHPDDDTAVSTYLAKAVFDEGRRVAVVFTNRGNSGPDAVGMAQSKALADVREIEARRSLALRGITNVWFLQGQDTPTQDVLHSLETLGHGAALEEIIRVIRLTRPEVILTWMPAYVAGENHGDHQAAGVIAVEGFDLAGNPTVFPEQLEAPRQRSGIANYGEGLHPWQTKKLYFFSDASHPEFLKGHGPTYLASDVSPAKKVPYSEINRLAWRAYATQLDFGDQGLSYYANMPEYLVMGKSLVPSPVDAAVWTGVGLKPISYVPEPTFNPRSVSIPPLSLGGPWAFYREFYPAHGLTSMENLVSPQTSLSADHQLWIPLLLHNPSSAPADLILHADLPAGWMGEEKDRIYHLQPGATYPIELFLTAPSGSNQKSPEGLHWTVSNRGVPAGQAGISVYMEYNDVPQ